MEKEFEKACSSVVDELSRRMLAGNGRTMSAGEKSALAAYIAEDCEKRRRGVPHIDAVEAAYDRGYEFVRVSEMSPDAEASFSFTDGDGVAWCVCGFSLMEDWRRVDGNAERCPIGDSSEIIYGVERDGWLIQARASTDDNGYADSDTAWLWIFSPDGELRGWGDLDCSGESDNTLQYGFPFTDRKGVWDVDWDMDDTPFMNVDDVFDDLPTGEEFIQLAEGAGVRFRGNVLSELKERTRDWLFAFTYAYEVDMSETADGYEWPAGAGESPAVLSTIEEKEGDLYSLADGYEAGAPRSMLLHLVEWGRRCVEAGQGAYNGAPDLLEDAAEAAKEELNAVREAQKQDDHWTTRGFWQGLRDEVDCDDLAAWWAPLEERLKAECARRAAVKK